MSASALPWPRRFPHGLLRTFRATASVVFGLLAAIGAVTAPQLTLFLGALFAALAAMLVCGIQCGNQVRLAHPAVVATAAGLLPAAVVGGAAAGVGALGVLWGTLALALSAVASWWVRPAAPRMNVLDPATAPPQDDASLVDLLRCLPIDVLCDEWSRIAMSATSSDGETLGRIRLRELLVAELRRRDDAGTSRWLSEAPGARPDRFVSGARDGIA